MPNIPEFQDLETGTKYPDYSDIESGSSVHKAKSIAYKIDSKINHLRVDLHRWPV